jgi:UDP-N-acetyl-2-amino-2-deoxyglucuronate dehydrogenase
MRFAIVGAGVIGGLHASVIASLEDAELVAVVDVDRSRAEKLASLHGAEALDSTEALADRPDIDAVAVCTPSGHHVDVAEAVLGYGKHVLVEKPIDVSLSAAQRLIAARQQSSRVVSVVSQHRFDASSVAVHDAISSGKLGDITSGVAEIPCWRSQAYYDSGDWRGTWELDGGGALLNQGIHTIDLLIWFLGRPVEAFGYVASLAHERIEVEDTLGGVIRFESGAIGMVQATTASYPGGSARVRVHGTRGTATIEGDELRYFHAAGEHEVAPDYGAPDAPNQARDVAPFGAESFAPRVAGIRPEPHTAQYRDFMRAVNEASEPLVTPEVATRTLAVVRALYESAEQGKPVAIDWEL